MGVGDEVGGDWTRYGAFAPREMAKVSSDDLAARKEGARVKELFDSARKDYEQGQAVSDERNLAFFKGDFYRTLNGAAVPQMPPQPPASAPSQNEVFPLVDAICTGLTRDCPQVELVDERWVADGEEATDAEAGMLAAVYNYVAREAQLGSLALPDVVKMATMYARGGYFKVAWDQEQQRPTIEARGPDEVFIDPLARSWGDVEWAAERFDLADEDMVARRESGTYTASDGEWAAIKPGQADYRTLTEQYTNNDELQARRASGDRWHHMVEWWDVRKGVVYHFHAETGIILAVYAAPVRLPYVQLIFHKIPRQVYAVPDVSLVADNQREINSLVATRSEMVARLLPKLAYDPGVFLNATEEKKFFGGRTWQPARVKTTDKPIAQSFYVSPDMPTGFDFNTHLGQLTESLRYTSGIDAWQRGKAQNIRTASEAQMLAGVDATRGDARVMMLDEVLRTLFDAVRQYLKWAIKNPEESGLDVALLCSLTQRGGEATVLEEAILADRRSFNILPFSPAGENVFAKRQLLLQLLPAATNGPLAVEFNSTRLAEQLVGIFRLPPSILNTPEEREQIKQMQAQAQAGAAGAGGMPAPGGAPPGMEGPLPGAAGAEGGEPLPPSPGDPIAPTPEELAALDGADAPSAEQVMALLTGGQGAAPQA